MQADDARHSSSDDLTRLLNAARQGDERAQAQLWDVIYEKMRAIAHNKLYHERRDHTMSTTALVHESYLKLAGGKEIVWESRTHFYCVAAMAMAQILVDYARKRRAQRRGGGVPNLPLGDRLGNLLHLSESKMDEIIAVRDSLEWLGRINPRLRKVVELRYFAGLPDKEIGEMLGIKPRTVQRDWKKARALLHSEIYGPDNPAEPPAPSA
ncbi:MAG: ECF-type sigma factor [Bacteroidota bacterium]